MPPTPGADPKPLGVVELEALPRSLLVLERDYTRGAGNLVRLFEAEPDPDGPGTLAKRLVLEWDAEGARGRDGKRLPGAPPVDNYEGLCLLPADVEERPAAHRRILLVNDDNANPTQIGTQLVTAHMQIGVRHRMEGGAILRNRLVCIFQAAGWLRGTLLVPT